MYVSHGIFKEREKIYRFFNHDRYHPITLEMLSLVSLFLFLGRMPRVKTIRVGYC